jgi:hypothetical protein
MHPRHHRGRRDGERASEAHGRERSARADHAQGAQPGDRGPWTVHTSAHAFDGERI